MGVTISCQKTKDSIDLGCGGFWNLRQQVAALASPEFAAHYKTLGEGFRLSGKDLTAFFAAFDEKTKSLIEAGIIDVKIADFLLQSDCGGTVHYGACKKILKAIGDYDDNICYGYTGRPDCTMFRDFKKILQECADNKCDMRW